MLTTHMRFLTLLLFLFTLSARGAIWYVKPTATGTGTGASVANAIGTVDVDDAASPGDEWRILGSYGTHPSISITKSNSYVRSCDMNGDPLKWAATVTGSAGTHGIYTADNCHGVTIEGFKILSAYIDGIKNNGNRATNRYNWVANAGRGDPSWVTNTAGTFSGNGIACHNKSDFDISFNFVENCGAKLTQDHGFYGGGTNGRIHGNIFANCDTGWGIQVFDSTGDNHNVWVTGNLVYGCGTQNGAGTQGAAVVETYGVKTNYYYNNTFITTGPRYGMIIRQANASARLYLKNNIIVGDTGYGVTAFSGAGGTNTVVSNNNLKNSLLSGEPQGANDVAGTATFDSTANGRYWLASGSAGIGMADASVVPAIDFFERTGGGTADVGFAQYEDALANDDSRDLTDAARDPWVREAGNLAVSRGPTGLVLTWTEQNQQHSFYYISRKDSVGNTFDILTTPAKGVLTYTDLYTGLTNGLTYTYTTTPETSLGNSGGIHSLPHAAIVNVGATRPLVFRAFRF